jgi:hypothetical protein
MFLSDLFDQLTFGEISQLNKGGEHNNQGVQPQDYPKVIPHINLALIEIYKRFDLKLSEVVVQQYDHIQLYYLRSKYAQTNTASTEPIKYIMDSIYQPFQDDLLRIEKVIDEEGKELYLNQEDSNFLDSNKYWSVKTPVFDGVQIPQPEKENQFIVTYRASHPLIPIKGVDPDTTEVNIPNALLEGVLLYIGGRVNLNRGTELSLAEGQTFMTKFELSMATVQRLNLVNTVDTLNQKLDKNGWA